MSGFEILSLVGLGVFLVGLWAYLVLAGAKQRDQDLQDFFKKDDE